MKTLKLTSIGYKNRTTKKSAGVIAPRYSQRSSQRLVVRNILNSSKLQPKLTIGQPNDIYELETDRVADQVMRILDNQVSNETEGDRPENHYENKPSNRHHTTNITTQFSLTHNNFVDEPGIKVMRERSVTDMEGSIDEAPLLELSLSEAAPAPPAIRTLNSSTRIQRNGLGYGYFRKLMAKSMYDGFIRNADKYGLPVKFLRRVGRDYDISFGSSAAVNTFLNTMTLPEVDLRRASEMAPALPIGEGSAIRTLYEEAAHAYLDLMSDEPGFQEFISSGKQHYEGALTTGGEATTDPSRVFQESAANYVGHCAATWWLAFEMLSIYASMAKSDPAAAARLKQMNTLAKLRDDYNNDMARVVFGYSEEGGFLGIGTRQASTIRAMSREMKVFLDRELLESKIPDNFDAVVGFQQLLSSFATSLSGSAATP